MERIVKIALEATLGGSMKAKSIVHPNDKGRAKETLEVLKRGNHTLDPKEITEYVEQSLGWSKAAQQDLKLMVERVNNKKSSTDQQLHWWKEDIYTQWKRQAEGAREEGEPSKA